VLVSAQQREGSIFEQEFSWSEMRDDYIPLSQRSVAQLRAQPSNIGAWRHSAHGRH
jgi:hypothetical protein